MQYIVRIPPNLVSAKQVANFMCSMLFVRYITSNFSMEFGGEKSFDAISIWTIKVGCEADIKASKVLAIVVSHLTISCKPLSRFVSIEDP